MKWERVNDYAIICGEYRIGKFNQGSTYGAWYGWQSLGYFPDAAAAKARCEHHLLSLRRTDSGNGRTRQAKAALPAAVGASES